MINKRIIVIAVVMLSSFLNAQQLESNLEKKSIFIGERNILTLDASTLPTSIQWPKLSTLNGVRTDAKNKTKDTIQLEVLQQWLDSTKNNVLKISFTAWDSGVVTILPILIDTLNDILFDPQLIWVKFPDINPEGDILDIEEGRVQIISSEDEADSWTTILWVIAILAILIAGIIIFLVYRNKKKQVPVEQEIALSLREQTEQKLRELFAKRYWLSNQQKLHFILLTDIMRWYVAKRYTMDTLEKTTMELNAAMRAKLIDIGHINVLTELLKQADFVKFAKLTLPENEVEVINQQAYYFIELTELKETTEEE